MEKQDKRIEERIKELRPRVASIAMTRLLDVGINSFIQLLLLMHKSPNQVETIINEVIKILGIESNPIKFFENLTDIEKENFILSEPLNEKNYNDLLVLVAGDILDNAASELKGDKNGK